MTNEIKRKTPKDILFGRLKPLDDPNKNSSFLELFFDLFYVVLISSTLHLFIHKVDKFIIIEVFSITVYLLYFWNMLSWFAQSFDLESMKVRLITFAQMILLILINREISNFAHHPLKFMYIWLALAFLWQILFFTLSRRIDFFKKVFWTRLFIFIVMVILTSINMMHPHMNTSYLYLFGALMILGSSLYRANDNNKRHLNTVEYITERWGLLILIVLAELLISAVEGYNHIKVFNTESVMSFVMSFITIIFFWTIYFDQINYIGMDRTKEQQWGVLHNLLIVLLIIIGGLMRVWLADGIHSDPMRIAWTISTGLSFIVIGLIRNYSSYEHDEMIREFLLSIKKKQVWLNIWCGIFAIVIGLISISIKQLGFINDLSLPLLMSFLVSMNFGLKQWIKLKIMINDKQNKDLEDVHSV